MISIKDIVADIISKCIDVNRNDICNMLEYPPDLKMGDVALPCFKLSRILKKSPKKIASELVDNIPKSEYIKNTEAVSGYLNFFLDRKTFIKEVIDEVFKKKNIYGSSNIGKNKRIIIDYSAPNIAKPLHIGHLRSTVVGNALHRIFSFMGYECIGINHLGDWGTQFGKLVVAYKKWGDEKAVEQKQISELTRLYIKFHEEAEKDKTLEDEARLWFGRMEKGDPKALELWKWFKDITMEELYRVYDMLGVNFDSYKGESFYEDKMKPVIEELDEKGLLESSEGASIVNLDKYDMPPCMILKKDGSTLYATRDITAALYRKKEYDFHKCIYVTATAQSLYFSQWFKVIELMGYKWSTDLVHVPFGLVNIEGEKLSTRKGNMVLLEELLNKAVRKTLDIINLKNPGQTEKEEIAREVGVGAVIFSDLSSNRIKDISFSWDEALNFDGETGPYVQYTYARTCSVMDKYGNTDGIEYNASLLKNSMEYELIKRIYYFPQKVELAMKEYEPSIITRYLIDLAQQFNRFYHETTILVNDEKIKNARIALVKATKQTLANGLKLIGLGTPERV